MNRVNLPQVVKEITYSSDTKFKTVNYSIRHGDKHIVLSRKNLFYLYASIADLLHDEELEAEKIEIKE